AADHEILAAIVASYRWSEDSRWQITAFGRLLHNLDTAPEWFEPHVLKEVYWWMHAVMERMVERPDVPLASVEEFLDQIRRRYAEAGRSLYSVHQVEHRLADHLGDDDRAARAMAAMRAIGSDYIDDCEPCIQYNLGEIAADADEHERALELWEPMLRPGGMSCPVEPDKSLAASLLPLLELGRLDQARANHLRGFQMIRDNDNMVLPVAHHVRFCALTGNEARAIEILTARARLLTLGLDPMFRLRLLESVQTTCRALAARGRGDARLPGPDGRPGRADDVHELVDAERREICERFDRRNGNDVQSRRSDARAEFTGDRPHVPLGLKTAVREAPRRREVRAEPAASTAADLERLLGEARATGAAFAEDRFEHWGRVGDLAERLGAALDPADEAEVLVARFNDSDDPERRKTLAERAVALLRKADRAGRALAVEAATLRTRAEEAPEDLRTEAARLLEAAEKLSDAEPDHALRVRAVVHCTLVEVGKSRGVEPEPELREALAGLDAELAPRSAERGIGDIRVRLLTAMASIAETAEAGHDAIRTAHELAIAGGYTVETVISAIWYTAALKREGRYEESLRVAETAAAAARPSTPDGPVAVINFAAAEFAVHLGHWSRAERYAVKAAHHYDRSGSGGGATAARHLAGLAMATQGRHEAAVLVLEAVLSELSEADEDEQWRSVDVRALLADSYDELGDPEEGSKHALEALRLMDGGVHHPDATRYPRTAHLAGVLLDRIGDGASAALAFDRAARAWREIGGLSMAARPIRAALWARSEAEDADAEADAAAFGSLEEELRADWRDGELPEGYRESCRFELAETLYQHAGCIDDDADAVRLLRESLDVFGEGAFAEREVEVAHRLMDRLAEAGDLAGAEATAEHLTGRLDPEAHAAHRKATEVLLAAHRDAAGR
ncbi:hypothetical protein, partial [Glycomyces tenuis]|uniref:hypothetical protein n=1 Tax=Glycomyces tenuis TaxID=58116 RepID=UPI000552E3A3